jgi:hypothetical protein
MNRANRPATTNLAQRCFEIILDVVGIIPNMTNLL